MVRVLSFSPLSQSRPLSLSLLLSLSRSHCFCFSASSLDSSLLFSPSYVFSSTVSNDTRRQLLRLQIRVEFVENTHRRLKEGRSYKKRLLLLLPPTLFSFFSFLSVISFSLSPSLLFSLVLISQSFSFARSLCSLLLPLSLSLFSFSFSSFLPSFLSYSLSLFSYQQNLCKVSSDTLVDTRVTASGIGNLHLLSLRRERRKTRKLD